MSLYVEWNVRTRLRVAISEVTGATVFYIKAGRPVKCLAQGHNKRTCRFVLHNILKMLSTKQGSCGYHILKSFGMTRHGE